MKSSVQTVVNHFLKRNRYQAEVTPRRLKKYGRWQTIRLLLFAVSFLMFVVEMVACLYRISEPHHGPAVESLLVINAFLLLIVGCACGMAHLHLKDDLMWQCSKPYWHLRQMRKLFKLKFGIDPLRCCNAENLRRQVTKQIDLMVEEIKRIPNGTSTWDAHQGLRSYYDPATHFVPLPTYTSLFNN